MTPDGVYVKDMPFREDSKASIKAKAPLTFAEVCTRISDKACYVSSLGYSVESDGSTNNLSELFSFIRDKLILRVNYIFWSYYVWSFMAGAILYFVSALSLSGVVDRSGTVNDIWNMGTAIVFSMVVSNHLFWAIESKSLNCVNVGLYVISFVTFMPLSVIMQDNHRKSDYFHQQFDYLFVSPLFYFVCAFTAIVTIMPRLVYIHL